MSRKTGQSQASALRRVDKGPSRVHPLADHIPAVLITVIVIVLSVRPTADQQTAALVGTGIAALAAAVGRRRLARNE
ncbi:hypothetical protein [Streptomyces prunicolor]|uniref:hypothetical protein n=1 Tax=Streptomyces prunicolor TaxID=67348 RepID=UPI001319C607|nr:hypothetical protein [Streptomyces prunicolor]